MLINHSKTKSNYLLSLLLFCYYGFAAGSFGVRSRYIWLATVIGTVIFILGSRRLRIKVSTARLSFVAMAFIILIQILNPLALHDGYVFNMIIYVISMSMVVLFAELSNVEVARFFKVVQIVGICVAMYISFFRIYSTLYFRLIVPHLVPDLAEKVLLNYNFGYGPAIGNSYTWGDCVIMLGVGAVLADDIASYGRKLINKVVLAVLIAGLILEGRKGELLSAIVTILITYSIFLDFKKIKYAKNKGINLMILLPGVLIGLFVFYSKGYFARFQIMFERILQSNGSAGIDFSSGRIFLWETAWKLFCNNPIWGIGWGRFANYTTGEFLQVYAGQEIRETHNVLLQLLCETGFIGTVLITFPIILLIYQAIRKILSIKYKKAYPANLKKLIIFPFVILVFHVCLSFIDPNVYGQNFWFMFAMAVLFEDYFFSIEKRMLMEINAVNVTHKLQEEE